MAPRALYFIGLHDEINVLTGRPFGEAERAPARAALEQSNRRIMSKKLEHLSRGHPVVFKYNIKMK